jgi:hypothetical protein
MLCWFGQELRSYSFQEVVDWLRGKDAPAIVRELSEEEIDAIANRLAEKISPKLAQEQKVEIYREVARDPSIRGIGVGTEHGKRPAAVVPRSEFNMRAGSPIGEVTVEKRTHSSTIKVVLIRPTLKGTPRSWSFQQGSLPEFSAKMKDEEFLQAIEEGRVSIPLRVGIEMEIELKAIEQKEGEVWVVKEREVTKVYRPIVHGAGSLFPSR